jgi:Protein of unknown function (DUF3309)
LSDEYWQPGAFAFVLSGFLCTRKDSVVQKEKSNMSSGAIILFIVPVMSIGAIPSLLHSGSFGYLHRGIAGLAFFILVTLLLTESI